MTTNKLQFIQTNATSYDVVSNRMVIGRLKSYPTGLYYAQTMQEVTISFDHMLQITGFMNKWAKRITPQEGEKTNACG